MCQFSQINVQSCGIYALVQVVCHVYQSKIKVYLVTLYLSCYLDPSWIHEIDLVTDLQCSLFARCAGVCGFLNIFLIACCGVEYQNMNEYLLSAVPLSTLSFMNVPVTYPELS
jgi:hypothetical protein